MLPFPARFPGLNTMENTWKILEDIIYDRSAKLNIADLKVEIQKAFLVINTVKRRININFMIL